MYHLNIQKQVRKKSSLNIKKDECFVRGMFCLKLKHESVPGQVLVSSGSGKMCVAGTLVTK